MSQHNNNRQHGLRVVIADQSFWTIPDPDLLNIIKSEFPFELQRLHNATFVRDTKTPSPESSSISEILYGKDYAEVNRRQSPAPRVLRRESFAWLRDIYLKGLQTSEDIYTLITSMDPNLATDYAQKEGLDISKVNHDMILYHAVQAGMVPALDRLTEENKTCLLLGIKLGSDFNFGQLAQAENSPASLASLADMNGHDRAFELRFMEQVLDLAGASGHEDWTCAKKMIEPILQSYRNVYDVAHAIISGKTGLREGYDIILTRKLELLDQVGYQRNFDIQIPSDRALMRLFCLGNTSNAQNAEMYCTAFTERIPEATRQSLVHGLNLDGTVEEPADQTTYIPAMLTKAVGNTGSGKDEGKLMAVTAMLRYLARCLVVDRSRLERLPAGVTVIERDVKKIVPVLESEEFRNNPDVLDKQEIPADQVANMVQGY
ncbi:hypothetical protein LTR40_000982 [Exophiala xenobiotica]|nr:hypothetical protein LTS06_007081 [Exophiala xenobiotica]KAK5262052.1 hypothetical protein LTR40_000982 [Exophiala xenobiotica]